MKKYIIILLVLFLVPLSACKNNSPIKIGYANVLSTNQRDLGIEGMYGAQLAIKEINENGGINGRPLELIMKDDESNSEKAVLVDNELMSEGVVAIIGHGVSSIADSVVMNSVENDILIISPTIATNSISNRDDNFFRMISTVDDIGQTIGQLLVNENYGDCLVLYESNNLVYSEQVLTVFSNTLAENGIVIPNENILSFTSGNSTSYSLAKEFLDTSEINNVLIIGSAYDVASIIQNIDTDKTLFLTPWSATDNLINLVGTNIEGSYVINYFDYDNRSAKYSAFVENYEKEYGKTPSFSSMFSYEAVYYLAEALKNTNDYSTEGIKAALLDIKSLDGLMDQIIFNPFGDIERKVYSFIIENQRYEVIENETN